MIQRAVRGVGVVMGTSASLCFLLAVASCVGGGRVHEGGVPVNPVAQFSAPECKVHTQAGVPAAEASFFMIDGRKAFSLLVLDQKGKGVELENYWKDDNGHHFAGNTQNGPAWHYLIPDKRGANGELTSYATYTLRNTGGHQEVDGEPKDTCQLKFLAAERWDVPAPPAAAAPAPTPTPAPAPPPAPATACVPGETRECVGTAACRGGQACLPDGSGFSACDCGPATAPAAPDTTKPSGSGKAGGK